MHRGSHPNRRVQELWADLLERLPADEVHPCPAAAPRDDAALYGPSITAILRSGDRWWAVVDGEYATPITYCPWCGIELSTAGGDGSS